MEYRVWSNSKTPIIPLLPLAAPIKAVGGGKGRLKEGERENVIRRGDGEWAGRNEGGREGSGEGRGKGYKTRGWGVDRWE